jgi:hypothetical protein
MNYEKIKEEAKISYLQIGQVWCPALESFISFNDSGFHHLIWKNRKHRSKGDQNRRFLLLPYAPNILTSTKIDITYQERDIIAPRNRYGEVEAAAFRAAYWAFVEKLPDKTITVIVRKVGNGEKHFYSIFDKI